MSNKVVSVLSSKFTPVSEIKCGKIDTRLKVRVIHLWSIPDRSNPSEEGSIHMLLLDEKCEKIHASIRKNLIPLFKEEIEEGSSYVFENFMVGSNDNAYKTTEHKYKLNFMGSTKTFKVTAVDIPKCHFQFVPFLEILAATREDKLLDVIGHVVEKDVLKATEKNGKKSKVMDVTLEDLEGNRVHCTLWDEYAERMKQFLDSHDSSQPVIVLLQLCKLKKFFGVMGVSNAFYGTKMLLNADLPDVNDYKMRLNETDVELTQVVSQMSVPTLPTLSDDLLHTRRMTIQDLIESTEKCFGSVLARTCELQTDLGWYYQACTKCASRVNILAGNMYCDRCKKTRTAVPRFKVHVQVIDNTGSTTFILFDRVVSQVLGRSVQDLLDGMAIRNDSSKDYPTELDVFVDKRMLFKVEVSESNLFRNWRSYTVKRLTEDNEIIKKFWTLHGINMGNEEEEANYVDALSEMADNIPMEVVEGGDSNHKDVLPLTTSETPTSKSLGKRTPDSLDAMGEDNVEGGEASTSKEPKMLCIKD